MCVWMRWAEDVTERTSSNQPNPAIDHAATTMSQSVDDAIAALFQEAPVHSAAQANSDKSRMGERVDTLHGFDTTTPHAHAYNPTNEQHAPSTEAESLVGSWALWNPIAGSCSSVPNRSAQAGVPPESHQNEPEGAAALCFDASWDGKSFDQTGTSAAQTTCESASAKQECESSEDSAQDSADAGAPSQGRSEAQNAPGKSKAKQRQNRDKIKLRAWTDDEHERFLYALDKFRTEKTEAVGPSGERSVGLGPGTAELIAMMVGTRSAIQVRSHAQKHFKKQRMLEARKRGAGSGET